MIAEMLIGRKTHRNPVGAFKALAPNTYWWLVGTLGVLSRVEVERKESFDILRIIPKFT